MNSPELLLLVENCPKGAETLVTRCLHILTDKGKRHLPHVPLPPGQMHANHEHFGLMNENRLKQVSVTPSVPPSPELVERVRDLYHKRVPDVRFLIPVINGLEKVKIPF